jgi:putative ABC transport system permease protein
MKVFLAEAALLSLLGGGLGLLAGFGGARLLAHLLPALPAQPPGWAVAAAMAVSLGAGIAFGVLQARRAARLDPVTALARH